MQNVYCAHEEQLWLAATPHYLSQLDRAPDLGRLLCWKTWKYVNMFRSHEYFLLFFMLEYDKKSVQSWKSINDISSLILRLCLLIDEGPPPVLVWEVGGCRQTNVMCPRREISGYAR